MAQNSFLHERRKARGSGAKALPSGTAEGSDLDQAAALADRVARHTAGEPGGADRGRIASAAQDQAITGTRLYSCDTGNDPRGPLGIHAADYLIASEYNMTGPDVIVSWIACNNDRATYEQALRFAKSQWTEQVTA